MSNTNSLAFRLSGSIDFDPSPIAPAVAPATAAAVDDRIDRDPLSVNFGREKLHKPAATERMLAGTTIDWLIAFAMDMRPKALCEKYPHVANRLAQEWRDKGRVRASLQALVDDARWGTTGYPVLVQGELRKLLALAG
jgi:hypothetical protein